MLPHAFTFLYGWMYGHHQEPTQSRTSYRESYRFSSLYLCTGAKLFAAFPEQSQKLRLRGCMACVLLVLLVLHTKLTSGLSSCVCIIPLACTAGVQWSCLVYYIPGWPNPVFVFLTTGCSIINVDNCIASGIAIRHLGNSRAM